LSAEKHILKPKNRKDFFQKKRTEKNLIQLGLQSRDAHDRVLRLFGLGIGGQ